MASKAFFKTNDAAVLASLATHYAEGNNLIKKGLEFAELFEGAQFFYRNDIHGYEAAGLKFSTLSPIRVDPLWTRPDKRTGLQRPKVGSAGLTTEQKTALKALREKYESNFPRDKADFAPTLALMGTSWSQLIFCGFGMFEFEDFVYATTSAKLAPCMVEILGSEYIAAKNAYDAAKEKEGEPQ